MTVQLHSVDLFETPQGEAYSWLASYNDGTGQREFEKVGEIYQRYTFESIQKDKLTKFGIVGFGQELFFDVNTGIFNILGNTVEVRVRDKATGVKHEFVRQLPAYDDLIMYRQGESLPPTAEFPAGRSFITGYFYGYKAKLENFFVTFIVSCVAGQGIGLKAKLVPNMDFDGEIILCLNGIETVLSSDSKFDTKNANEFEVTLVNTSQNQ